MALLPNTSQAKQLFRDDSVGSGETSGSVKMFVSDVVGFILDSSFGYTCPLSDVSSRYRTMEALRRRL